MALQQEAPEILTQFFSAWSLREPDRILAVVSPDISIIDPNGSYQGAAALHEHVVGILRSFDFAPAKIATWNEYWDPTLRQDLINLGRGGKQDLSEIPKNSRQQRYFRSCPLEPAD
jgi:hypothetical protein